MALTRRQHAAIHNSSHPFFTLPAELRNIIYGMSQMETAQHDHITIAFDGQRPLFAGFTGQVSLLHVSRRFRRELLPFIFQDRHLSLLYDGALTQSIPPAISTLSTAVLQMVSSVTLDFQVLIPPALHYTADQPTCPIQVTVQDGRYDIAVHIGTHWENCHQPLLLDFLARRVVDLGGSLKTAMRLDSLVERNVTAYLIHEQRPLTASLFDELPKMAWTMLDSHRSALPPGVDVMSRRYRLKETLGEMVQDTKHVLRDMVRFLRFR